MRRNYGCFLELEFQALFHCKDNLSTTLGWDLVAVEALTVLWSKVVFFLAV